MILDHLTDIRTSCFVSPNSLHWSTTSSSLCRFLPVSTSLDPYLAKSLAVAAPIPELAPEDEIAH